MVTMLCSACSGEEATQEGGCGVGGVSLLCPAAVEKEEESDD